MYGSFLAVYAILAWTSWRPPLVNVMVRTQTQSGGLPIYTPIYPAAPAIAGQVASIISVDASLQTGSPAFRADGTWMELNDGGPMFIIQPGQQLVVWTTGAPAAASQTGPQLTCAFMYGVY